MRRFGYILITLALILTGCGRQDIHDEYQGEVEFEFPAFTKAGSPSEDTFMTLLLDRTSKLYTGLHGSYRQKDAKAWMTPCQVDASGVWMADDSRYGLRANVPSGVNSFQLTVVSPAIAPNWHVLAVADPPTPEKWGYSLTRSGDGLYISHQVQVTVNGNHMNRKYVYQFPEDNLLTDRRAKVTVKMQCGEDLASVHIKKIEIMDFYQDAKFNLATDSIENMTVDAVGEVLYSEANPVLDLINGEAATTIVTDYHLFALNYVKRDEEYHYVYSIPRLLLTMADDSKVSVPFYHELKPQYSYTYTLLINSAFVTLNVNAEPWNEYAAQDAVIGAPVTDTFTVTTAGDWIEQDGGTATI